MVRLFILALGLSIQAMSCSMSGAESGTKIILTRTPCESRHCPSYTMTIDGDGKVVYESGTHPNRIRHEKRIAVSQVKVIVEKIKEIDFFALSQKIDALDCETLISDISVFEIEFFQDGKHSSVMHGNRCYSSSVFAPLDQLGKLIDDTVQVGEWTEQK